MDKNKIFLINRGGLEGRLDSFFYKKEFIDNTDKIEKVEHFKIGNLVTLSNKTWDKTKHNDEYFNYIEISKIDTLTGEIKEPTTLEVKEAPSRAKMFLKLDDIIVSSTRPHRGAIAYISEEYEHCIASTGFIVIGYSDDSIILRKYILEVLKQDIILKQLLQKSTGGNYPAITEDAFKNVILPVPKLTIQKNIINIMDNAYKLKKQKEQEAKDLLDGIDDYLLDKLGIKLPDEPENSIENRTFKVGFDDIFNSRFDSFYNKLYYIKVEEELYKTKYPLVNLMELCNGIRGVTYSSDDEANDGKIGVLRGNNIDLKTNELDLTNIRYLKSDFVFSENQKLQKNDILMSAASGSKEHVGKVAYIANDLNHYFGAFMMVLRVYNEKVNPFFLFGYLQSKLFRQLLMRILGGTNINNLNFNMIKNYKVPLPNIDIQNEIVKEISKRRHKARKLNCLSIKILEKAKKEVENIILGEDNGKS